MFRRRGAWEGGAATDRRRLPRAPERPEVRRNGRVRGAPHSLAGPAASYKSGPPRTGETPREPCRASDSAHMLEAAPCRVRPICRRRCRTWHPVHRQAAAPCRLTARAPVPHRRARRTVLTGACAHAGMPDKDVLQRAARMLREGATLKAEPCPYCGGVRVMRGRPRPVRRVRQRAGQERGGRQGRPRGGQGQGRRDASGSGRGRQWWRRGRRTRRGRPGKEACRGRGRSQGFAPRDNRRRRGARRPARRDSVARSRHQVARKAGSCGAAAARAATRAGLAAAAAAVTRAAHRGWPRIGWAFARLQGSAPSRPCRQCPSLSALQRRAARGTRLACPRPCAGGSCPRRSACP